MTMFPTPAQCSQPVPNSCSQLKSFVFMNVPNVPNFYPTHTRARALQISENSWEHSKSWEQGPSTLVRAHFGSWEQVGNSCEQLGTSRVSGSMRATGRDPTRQRIFSPQTREGAGFAPCVQLQGLKTGGIGSSPADRQQRALSDPGATGGLCRN